MFRALSRLKKRRLQRCHDGVQEKYPHRDSEKCSILGNSLVVECGVVFRNYFKKRQSVVVDDDTDEAQSRPIHPDFRHWSKYDPFNYNPTFQ